MKVTKKNRKEVIRKLVSEGHDVEGWSTKELREYIDGGGADSLGGKPKTAAPKKSGNSISVSAGLADALDGQARMVGEMKKDGAFVQWRDEEIVKAWKGGKIKVPASPGKRALLIGSIYFIASELRQGEFGAEEEHLAPEMERIGDTLDAMK